MRDSFVFESRIFTGGRTTLPKAVRDALGLQTGDRVRYVVLESEVRIIKVRSIGRLYGVLQHEGLAVTLEDMERAIVDGATGAEPL